MVASLVTAPYAVYAQTTVIPGNTVVVPDGKLGVGTSTPSQRIQTTSSEVWDGIQIINNAPSGAGAYLGIVSTGGLRGGLDVYVDARSGENALKFQTTLPQTQFWTLIGNPFKVMTLDNVSGDVFIQGKVYADGAQLGPVPGPKGDKGDRGDKGDKGDKGEKGDPAGVTSLNNIIGGISLQGSSNIGVDALGNVLTITNRGVTSVNNQIGNVRLEAGNNISIDNLGYGLRITGHNSGVTSLNNQTGGISLSEGSGIRIETIGPSIKISQLSSVSSRRYKEDISDMGETSSGLMKLRPVMFRYRKAGVNGTKPMQYGLIAEEVADVLPDVVERGPDGLVESVDYHKINAMLLNEVQKQKKLISDLESRIVSLEQLKGRMQ